MEERRAAEREDQRGEARRHEESRQWTCSGALALARRRRDEFRTHRVVEITGHEDHKFRPTAPAPRIRRYGIPPESTEALASEARLDSRRERQRPLRRGSRRVSSPRYHRA